MSYRLNTAPTRSELDVTKQWLYEEYLSFNSCKGFYCNWDIIEKGLSNNRVFTYLIDEVPTGIVLWRECEGVIDIDILVIAPLKRGLGFGQLFFDALCNYFKQNGAFAIKLFCEPEESINFWEGKMKFVRFPDRGYSESTLTCYKPLIPTTALSTNIESSTCKLELWNVEPYLAARNTPKWSWGIDKLHLLTNPIIQPCNCNWNLRFIENGSTIKEDKIKYLGVSSCSLMKGEFLYIDNLNF